MKVIIIGYGSVGMVLSKLLYREKSISQIVCADIKLKNKHHKKMFFRKLNLSNAKNIIRIFREFKPDVIVNTSLPKFNIPLIESCLKERINYIDLASYWGMDSNPKSKSPYKVEQLDYNEKFKENRLIGLINAGVSPGLTNLIVRECADLLDKVNTIKIRLFEFTGSNELAFAWSKEWLLDEINWKPLVYRNKKFRILENFSEDEDYIFPAPIGKKKVYLISQEEIGTIPLFIKVKNVDIKSYDNQIDIAKFLFKSGLVQQSKIRFGKAKITPIEFLSRVLPSNGSDVFKSKDFEDAQFGFSIEVLGKKRGKRTVKYSVVFPQQKIINGIRIDANFISYPTALMAKLFVLSIEKIRNYGVYPPECLEKEARNFIIAELRKREIMVKKSVSKG